MNLNFSGRISSLATLKTIKKLPLLFLLFASQFIAGCHIFVKTFHLAHSESDVKLAEKFAREGKIDEAINTYKRHTETRVKAVNRPKWENPYFYYLIIGDLQLKKNLVIDAIASFKLAEKNNVEKSLIADRYRKAAEWYEQNTRLEEAVKLLENERELDSLLFDSMLDRLAKKITAKEELRN